MINATPRNGEGGEMSKHGDAIIKLFLDLDSTRKELEKVRTQRNEYRKMLGMVLSWDQINKLKANLRVAVEKGEGRDELIR